MMENDVPAILKEYGMRMDDLSKANVIVAKIRAIEDCIEECCDRERFHSRYGLDMPNLYGIGAIVPGAEGATDEYRKSILLLLEHESVALKVELEAL